jgi:hypothetical protein
MRSFALVAVALSTSACAMFSGVGDLEVVDPAAGETDRVEPLDGGASTGTDASSERDGASATDARGDASPEEAGRDAGPPRDSGPDAPTCGSTGTAALTGCASDAQLSSQIVTCRQFCAARGSCCGTSCTFLGLPVAGAWYKDSLICNLSADYYMSSCDEAIRGSTPGYFQCCCY